jgi:hypothetical protein
VKRGWVAAQQGFPYLSLVRGGFGVSLASSLRVGTLIGVDGARVSRVGVQRKEEESTHDDDQLEKRINQKP